MNVRQAGWMCLLLCPLTIPLSFAAEGDDKPTKKTVRAEDGVSIICEVRGKGDTALVFLHGWCGDRQYWKNQVDEFSRDYRVVTLDQAGHGQSGKDRKAWTVSSLAEDVESVVKALGLKRVILIGHSMGGPVSLLAAARMPDTVVAVIGVDTLQNAEFKPPEEMRTKFLEGLEKNFKETMRAGIGGMIHEKSDAELKRSILERAEAQDPKMAMGFIRDMAKRDLKEMLKRAKKPVRCINSSGSFRYFTPTKVDVNKKYADYAALTIAEVGHYPMLEKPTEFNKKLREVLKEFAAKE